ncbi:unnamed protein product [Fraxinus pennsylvanica]|uniref:Cyclin n=1 Tax=Fraxinus pennsylvanica TaxID=56036 RepID=A0AAD2DYR4_9LAMI|nr:unnamed protein product [Fraxinus pennsylvanica]
MSSSGGDNHRAEPKLDEPTTPRVLTILSCVLKKLVARNDQLVLSLAQLGKSFNAFHGVRAPNITIPNYIERIYKYTNCSPSCFVVGYVYIDRLVHRYPDSLVVSLNVHRLLVTCVMVASKILDDVHYNNAFYARVGGVTNTELNKLEIELLFLLDFRVTVSSRVFESYCQHLEKEMMCNDATRKIERLPISNSVDDVIEISVEDTQTSSPPQIVD